MASQGKTVEEAISNLKEALALFYVDNDAIPEYNPVLVTTVEVAI